MKKILITILLLSLLVLSITACQGGETVENSAATIATAVADVSGIQEQKELTQDNLTFDLALTTDNIVEFSGYTTNVVGQSGTVLVIKAAEGKAADVKAELEAYKVTNADFLSLYPEFETAQAQAENGRIVAKADVVVLAIAGPDADYAAIDTAIEENLM